MASKTTINTTEAVEKSAVSKAAPIAPPSAHPVEEENQPIFKKSSLSQNDVGGKKRLWKSLKQILATERTLQWTDESVTYSSINPPPSFRPAKKYSDITGLLANYTDPQTKLNYHNSDEFQTVRSLPSDLTAGFLALRGASSIVG